MIIERKGKFTKFILFVLNIYCYINKRKIERNKYTTDIIMGAIFNVFESLIWATVSRQILRPQRFVNGTYSMFLSIFIVVYFRPKFPIFMGNHMGKRLKVVPNENFGILILPDIAGTPAAPLLFVFLLTSTRYSVGTRKFLWFK